MSSSKQELKAMLTQGKLETALTTLVGLTEHTDDAELRQRVLTLSGQFAQLKKQHLTGLLDDKDYRVQWNRIAAAVADIVENEAVESGGATRSHPVATTRRWKKWTPALGIFAAIAGITGYNVFFEKAEPTPVILPAAEQPEKDTIVIVMPPPGKSVGKNNVNITVKDKAKVGNIITGDSNKIDIKQDF